MLPYLLSVPNLAFRIFWLNELPQQLSEDDAFRSIKESRPAKVAGIPLGCRLVEALIGLLFKPNFTIAPASWGTTPFESTWADGVQFAHRLREEKSPATYDGARVDVLRVLLVCLSEGIYTSAGEPLNYFAFCATCGSSPYQANLFLSLLNTVLAYDWRGYVLYHPNLAT